MDITISLQHLRRQDEEGNESFEYSGGNALPAKPHIAHQMCLRLRHVIVTSSFVSFSLCLQLFEALKSNTTVTSLNLSHNSITDDGVQVRIRHERSAESVLP